MTTLFAGSEDDGRAELDDEDPEGLEELDDEEAAGLDDDDDSEAFEEDDEDDGRPADAAAIFAFSLSRSFSACCRAISDDEEDDPELELRAAEDDQPEGADEEEDALTVGTSGSGLAFNS